MPLRSQRSRSRKPEVDHLTVDDSLSRASGMKWGAKCDVAVNVASRASTSVSRVIAYLQSTCQCFNECTEISIP